MLISRPINSSPPWSRLGADSRRLNAAYWNAGRWLPHFAPCWTAQTAWSDSGTAGSCSERIDGAVQTSNRHSCKCCQRTASALAGRKSRNWTPAIGRRADRSDGTGRSAGRPRRPVGRRRTSASVIRLESQPNRESSCTLKRPAVHCCSWICRSWWRTARFRAESA